MAIRQPFIVHAKHILRRSNSFAKEASSTFADVPKGFLAVYVGESQKKRFVVPISFLNQPSFQDCLTRLRKNLDSIIQWVVSQFPPFLYDISA